MIFSPEELTHVKTLLKRIESTTLALNEKERQVKYELCATLNQILSKKNNNETLTVLYQQLKSVKDHAETSSTSPFYQQMRTLTVEFVGKLKAVSASDARELVIKAFHEMVYMLMITFSDKDQKEALFALKNWEQEILPAIENWKQNVLPTLKDHEQKKFNELEDWKKEKLAQVGTQSWEQASEELSAINKMYGHFIDNNRSTQKTQEAIRECQQKTAPESLLRKILQFLAKALAKMNPTSWFHKSAKTAPDNNVENTEKMNRKTSGNGFK